MPEEYQNERSAQAIVARLTAAGKDPKVYQLRSERDVVYGLARRVSPEARKRAADQVDRRSGQRTLKPLD